MQFCLRLPVFNSGARRPGRLGDVYRGGAQAQGSNFPDASLIISTMRTMAFARHAFGSLRFRGGYKPS